MKYTDESVPSLKRLLVIDSDAAIHGLFHVLFADLLAVDTLSTVETALRKASRQSYDTVLIGVGADKEIPPGGSPLDRLRMLDNYADVPVIAMTTQVGQEQRAKLLERGFDGYVEKPFTQETLLEGIIEAFY